MHRKLQRSVIEILRSSATRPKESLSVREPIWPMIAAMGYEHILVEIEPPIAMVTLNRPKVLNALSPDLIREVNEALGELDADENVKAVVLTGGHRVFAAGADIGDMADRSAVNQLRRDQTGGWAGIAACSKPLIAAVNGYALGGGCELALMCDLIIAGDMARLGQPEINLGIIPGAGGTQGWPPNARASTFCFRPRTRRKACMPSWKSEKACSREDDIATARVNATRSNIGVPAKSKISWGDHRQVVEMATEVEQHVKVATEGGVGWITLNRPEKMNAIGAVTRKQLGDAIKQVERDDAVRVVVLIGSGRAFCSGADVTEMAQSGDGGMRTPEDVGNVLRNEYMPMLTRLRTMPKPVIAALNGPAVGIGASYALACDIRIAVPEAYLLEAFINIGLAPDGGASWLLPRLVGTGVAYEMFFTGKPLQAADAHRLGLINRVVPQERFEEEVRELATQLVAQPPKAMAAAKRAVNHALESSYEEALEFESYLQEAQAASQEFADGVQAFLARRAKK